MSIRKQLPGILAVVGLLMASAMTSPVFGQDAPTYSSYEEFAESGGFSLFTVNNLWVLISAALVFIMHLGFSCVETGLTQSKNTVNILFKNLFIVCIGILGYAFWGFNAMYPADPDTASNVFLVGSWFGIDNNDVTMVTDLYNNYTWWSDFIFQAMFAATAATIVSGAVAERVKLGSFMIYATLLVTFIYPMTGLWDWGYGWLDDRGFTDFAGSTLVHAFGGWAAFAAVIVLGPRTGKYVNGKVKPILGHSMPLAAIGVFMLWLGWYGFNGGSVLSADPRNVSYVFVTTTIAAAAGAVTSMLVSWVLLNKPDLSMGLNGVLAGLVGITAGADSVTVPGSVWIGLVAGALVVFSIIFFDKIKIDDPVGAISVHGVCGIWGTLAVAIFGDASTFGVQLLGTLSISATAFIASFILMSLLKVTLGIRVSADEESEGLDIGEHGQEAYPGFQSAH